ncbi:MAG: hypothetical protein IKR07_04140 [Oscillospiraceae bacterium]|nr:hypothetical protein [Oscillospiraceae bacterium]
MNDIIVANPDGTEVRVMLFNEYDFEIGDEENSFLITSPRAEWERVEENSRIYIPGTEYGGLYKRLESDTKNNSVAVGGLTWRGMMQRKIISPASGADYATDSGELNQIIGSRVSAQFPGLFVGSSESTGVTINYQYARYCTLYDGLKAMLKSVGYRMQIEYDLELKKVVVSAVPIVDYSREIEYSSDMNADYTMIINRTGINHLVCLGQGELKNRIVEHLYVDARGNISQRQTFFDEDEIAEVYDYAGASREDLIQSGIDQLVKEINLNEFRIEIESEREVQIGDIVGSRDYVTGHTVSAPITTKLVKFEDGFAKIEYKLSDDVTVESI